jgi:hypothetical protein
MTSDLNAMGLPTYPPSAPEFVPVSAKSAPAECRDLKSTPGQLTKHSMAIAALAEGLAKDPFQGTTLTRYTLGPGAASRPLLDDYLTIRKELRDLAERAAKDLADVADDLADQAVAFCAADQRINGLYRDAATGRARRVADEGIDPSGIIPIPNDPIPPGIEIHTA